jgi:glycerol-3-phosphate cytidylyltransferase
MGNIEKYKRVGITASAFDLLHSGHIAMLREAKEQCDYLICALHVDPSLDRIEKNTPIQNVVERYTQLSAVKYVDEVVPYLYEKELIDILEMYMPDVRILGDEYKDTEFTGRELCDKLGIELYFNSRNHRFSSSELRKRLKGSSE